MSSTRTRGIRIDNRTDCLIIDKEHRGIPIYVRLGVTDQDSAERRLSEEVRCVNEMLALRASRRATLADCAGRYLSAFEVVDEFCPADIDAGGGRIPPHDARASLRLVRRAHAALHKYRGRISWQCATLNRHWSEILAQAKRRVLITPSGQTRLHLTLMTTLPFARPVAR